MQGTQSAAAETRPAASLATHTESLRVTALKKINALEQKMLRAEKRKFADQQQQLQKIKEHLFPKNSLQERVENFSSFYEKWGSSFIEELYKNSLAMEQEFCILMQQPLL